MFGYAYTLHDNTFESNWDVVEDKQIAGVTLIAAFSFFQRTGRSHRFRLFAYIQCLNRPAKWGAKVTSLQLPDSKG